MFIGFISYSFGDHYSWLCKDWEEMYNFCKSDIGILIPKTPPNNIEDNNYFAYCKDIEIKIDLDDQDFKDTWISIGKASKYSLNQIKLFKNES